MKNESLLDTLTDRFRHAVAQVAGKDPHETDPVVRASQEPRHGDYQCNAAMGLAKELRTKPRDVAQRIVEAVELSDLCEPPEIAGPGFINVRLRADFLAGYLGEIPAPPPAPSEPDAPAKAHSEPGGLATGMSGGTEAPKHEGPQEVCDRLGMSPVAHPQAVVIDYSSPNIAKQMHVGHLRSTIIGDVFSRVLGFEGHEVIRQNHVGDWGTQFGRIIVSLWHICMAEKRGARGYILDLSRRLREAVAEGEDAERALLNQIVETHNRDLQDDVKGERHFDPFLKKAFKGLVSADELEQAYQFVTLVEDRARGKEYKTTLHTRSVGEPRAIPYEHLSREITAMLQEGGEQNQQERDAWKDARAVTLKRCGEMYRRLGVLLEDSDVCGESFYQEKQDRLGPVVDELREALPERGAAASAAGPYAECRDDQGAACIFFYDETGESRFKTKDGTELPMIIRKSDGAYLYATTDLAALRYRIRDLGASRLIYVTDGRQQQHFAMLFAAARAVGWAGDDVLLEHAWFGSILGTNRRPLKTREGDNVKLAALLDEAETRAYELLSKRERDEAERGPTPSFTEEEKRAIARRVSIGAVKYADLSRDRKGDYIFNWDTMLAMQGNTAPYMMYAYARIRSIYRKAAERFAAPDVYAAGSPLVFEDAAERALGLRLARLREAIDEVAAGLAPHTLCNYLYELAADFMRFYEACPVLQAPDEATRLSRMRLCDLAARSLRLGLGLLGIDVVERM
ncbi:MAG: arginine--tRNA ligase [Planctomycetes bacterium]|nr:arginine--tRNA ligase [Planctomycetota bacterium]